MPGCASGGLVLLCYPLLIRGILAALRQKFQLSACPNLPGHLSSPRFVEVVQGAGALVSMDGRKRPVSPAFSDRAPSRYGRCQAALR